MYFESFLWQVYSRVSRAVVSYDILNRKLFGRLVVRVTMIVTEIIIMIMVII